MMDRSNFWSMQLFQTGPHFKLEEVWFWKGIFPSWHNRLNTNVRGSGKDVFRPSLSATFEKSFLMIFSEWVSKSTHPRKFGNHVTDRPSDRLSVRTTGIPMFTLTLSSYFRSPGESWLHINVVVNLQLSKQDIRWPALPDRIAGSGVHPSRSSILFFFWVNLQGKSPCQHNKICGHSFLYMALW